MRPPAHRLRNTKKIINLKISKLTTFIKAAGCATSIVTRLTLPGDVSISARPCRAPKILIETFVHKLNLGKSPPKKENFPFMKIAFFFLLRIRNGPHDGPITALFISLGGMK